MNLRVILVGCFAILTSNLVSAESLSPGELQQIRFDQHPGQSVSRSLMFEAEDGRRLALGDLLNSKPTILVPGYYRCPMLCTFVNHGLIETLQDLKLDVGRDFNIIEVSIDPDESLSTAGLRKREYLRRYGRPGADDSWHFLKGDRATVAQLTSEIGFRFVYDPATREYAHPTGFLVLTPDGKISRYFFGVNYDARELHDALITAAKGERGSIIQQLALLCYHYNPVTGKYGGLVLNTLRGAGVATLALLGAAIVWMCRSPGQTKSYDTGP